LPRPENRAKRAAAFGRFVQEFLLSYFSNVNEK
jgi:hypothetical protein